MSNGDYGDNDVTMMVTTARMGSQKKYLDLTRLFARIRFKSDNKQGSFKFYILAENVWYICLLGSAIAGHRHPLKI